MISSVAVSPNPGPRYRVNHKKKFKGTKSSQNLLARPAYYSKNSLNLPCQFPSPAEIAALKSPRKSPRRAKISSSRWNKDANLITQNRGRARFTSPCRSGEIRSSSTYHSHRNSYNCVRSESKKEPSCSKESTHTALTKRSKSITRDPRKNKSARNSYTRPDRVVKSPTAFSRKASKTFDPTPISRKSSDSKISWSKKSWGKAISSMGLMASSNAINERKLGTQRVARKNSSASILSKKSSGKVNSIISKLNALGFKDRDSEADLLKSTSRCRKRSDSLSSFDSISGLHREINVSSSRNLLDVSPQGTLPRRTFPTAAMLSPRRNSYMEVPSDNNRETHDSCEKTVKCCLSPKHIHVDMTSSMWNLKLPISNIHSCVSSVVSSARSSIENIAALSKEYLDEKLKKKKSIRSGSGRTSRDPIPRKRAICRKNKSLSSRKNSQIFDVDNGFDHLRSNAIDDFKISDQGRNLTAHSFLGTDLRRSSSSTGLKKMIADKEDRFRNKSVYKQTENYTEQNKCKNIGEFDFSIFGMRRKMENEYPKISTRLQLSK